MGYYRGQRYENNPVQGDVYLNDWANIGGVERFRTGGVWDNNPEYIGMSLAGTQLSSPLDLNAAPSQALMAAATRRGLTPQSAALVKQQMDMGRRAVGNVRAQAQGEAETARSALASRGGLTSGASERIAQNAGNRALDLSQAMQAETARNIVDLGAKDEMSRQGLLAPASNVALGQAQFERSGREGDYERKERELANRRKYMMGLYDENLRRSAAADNSQAIAKSGKK